MLLSVVVALATDRGWPVPGVAQTEANGWRGVSGRSDGAMTPFRDEMRARLRDNSTDGLIVVKNEVTLQQNFRFAFDIDDIHSIHAVGKVFNSFAIQPIYDRIGPDGLNRRHDEYLPRLEGNFIALDQALDIQNGMEWTENDEDPTTATTLSGPAPGLLRAGSLLMPHLAHQEGKK